jgi:hypothetical protein
MRRFLHLANNVEALPAKTTFEELRAPAEALVKKRSAARKQPVPLAPLVVAACGRV